MSNRNTKQPKSPSSEYSPQLLAERYCELKRIRELVREAELQLDPATVQPKANKRNIRD